MVAKNDIGHPDNWPDHPANESVVSRLRKYRGLHYQTTECFNGLRDEAASAILRLQNELEMWRTGVLTANPKKMEDNNG